MNVVRSTLTAGLLLAVALAGCAGASAPSPSPSSPPPTDAPPTQVPGGQGPGTPPPSAGVVDPGVIGGGGNPGNPGAGNFVVPRPGTIDPRPVSIESLEARVDGRSVVIVATWTSGVEPCYVLDTAAVKKDGNEFTVALTEGAGQADAICIEIAQHKATAIDLGELAPGEYTVTAQGGTPSIPFTIA